MGKKVSIDSATLMNKGLEVIEARWLFGISEKIIEILIHPQSLVHSMVEYIDGSIIAHIGKADMRIPIAYALSYPKRHALNIPSLNLIEERFNFEKPDSKRFPCYLLAYKALEIGGTAPAVLNAANEEAVNAFLKLTLSFEEIYKVITHVLKIHKPKQAKTLTNIFEADKWARKEAKKFIGAKDEKKNPQR
jgi:1-deoxy-D-xylulose-5-phosphate reductoisomerase